jgi:hypothetical protein
MDVYLLEGKILNDSELTRRMLEMKVTRAEALKSLSPQECVALRERVTGVVPFRGRPQ